MNRRDRGDWAEWHILGKGLGMLGEDRRTKEARGGVERKLGGTEGFLAEKRVGLLLWKQGHLGQGQV